jgi:hypothetical protein
VKILKQFRRNYTVARTDSAQDGIRKYRASQKDCQVCALKARCCPNILSRKVLRSIHEEARDQARQLAGTPQFAASRNERKKVEMLFAHLKTTLRFERMRLRGLTGAKDEFHGQPFQILRVPLPQSRVLGFLADDGVLRDGVAEVIHHRRDREDAAQPLVQTFLRVLLRRGALGLGVCVIRPGQQSCSTGSSWGCVDPRSQRMAARAGSTQNSMLRTGEGSRLAS